MAPIHVADYWQGPESRLKTLQLDLLMGSRKEEQRDGWIEGRRDGWTDGRMDGWTVGQRDGEMELLMDGRMDCWMDGFGG